MAKDEREAGLGRNCTLFDWLRALAYKEVLRLKQAGADYGDFLQGLLAAAVDMDCTFYRPLSQGEVFGIVKSVARWTWSEFWPERFSARQSWCGSRGMAKRWTAASRPPKGLLPLACRGQRFIARKKSSVKPKAKLTVRR